MIPVDPARPGPPPPARPPRPDRRAFLARALGAAGGCLALPVLLAAPGCTSEEAPPPVARIPLDRLPPGGRVVVRLGDVPVEVSRAADRAEAPGGIVARSLLCTHMGCVVEPEEDGDGYRCPCHDARFDARGRPEFGPATRPLTEVPVAVAGPEILVGPLPGD